MIRSALSSLKQTFPNFFRRIFALRDWVRSAPARLRLTALQKADGRLAVAYLSPRFPNPPARRDQFAHGGAVKLTYLAENFPHHFPSANLLYAVSSVGHPLQTEILQRAKSKGLKIIVNQNGVAFPAWDGENYQASNRPLKALVQRADFIVYQSQFCNDSAERYISPPNVPHEVVYNPVDVRLFSPASDSQKPQALTLLLGGNQYEKYRLELALQTLAVLRRAEPNAKLIVTGALWLPRREAQAWTKQALREMNLTDSVIFTGTYAQTDAPALYAQAHLLLHTKYADPSPGLVLEALALGLPVVYLKNGGVPELVGEAGVGAQVEHDWEKINLPEPQALADAALQAFTRRAELSQRARQRAVDLFSLEKFISRHEEIFEKVLSL
ncbi:MAG: glycosyltransferase family 4 protein [Anaerolineales bacterium]|nr:glycosyltransferase family 4 protein [Anaerolineales bacterium]